MAAHLSGEDAREFVPVLRELRAAGLDPTVLDIEPNDPTEGDRS
jgi:hypothetical protein